MSELIPVRSFLKEAELDALQEQFIQTAEQLKTGLLTPEQFAKWMIQRELDHQKELHEANDRADHDSLVRTALTKTGLAKRFDETISGQIRESRDSGIPISGSLLFLDLDHFKEVNDKTAGRHSTGNALLIALGEIVSQKKRPDDLFARLGGEEFAMYLHDTEGDEAVFAAERFRVSIMEELTPIIIGELGRPQTVSIGISSISSIPETKREAFFKSLRSIDDKANLLLGLIEDADKGTYAAKHSGRNTIAFVHNERGNTFSRIARVLRSVESPDQKVVSYSQPKPIQT